MFCNFEPILTKGGRLKIDLSKCHILHCVRGHCYPVIGINGAGAYIAVHVCGASP